MRKSGEVLRQLGVIEPQTFAERIGEFLRTAPADQLRIAGLVSAVLCWRGIGRRLEEYR